MPRVLVPMLDPSRTGVVLSSGGTNGDPVNNHYTPNNGKTIVVAKNTGAVPRTITFRIKKAADPDVAITHRAEPIPAGEQQLFSDFSVDVYGPQLDIDVDNAELKLWVIKG